MKMPGPAASLGGTRGPEIIHSGSNQLAYGTVTVALSPDVLIVNVPLAPVA